MHHALPLPATKIKRILALADEDGMRGGAWPWKMAEEDPEGRLELLLCSLSPTALPVCPLDLASPVVSPAAQEHLVAEEEARSMT